MEIGFLISFSFCILILLIALRFSTINWKFKAMLMIFSIGSVFMFYNGLIASLGWPLDYKPTGVILIDGVDIRPPDDKSPGIIYIWYIDPESKDKNAVPRSIHIPYEKSDHKTLSKAQEMTQAGIPAYVQFGKPTKSDNPPSQGNGGPGQPGSEPNLSNSDEQSAGGSLNFVPPPNTLPSKNSP